MNTGCMYPYCWIIQQIFLKFFKESPYCSPQRLYQFTFPPTVQELPFLYTLSSIIICTLFDDGHSDWCEMMFHCGFDLHCCNNQQCFPSFLGFPGGSGGKESACNARDSGLIPRLERFLGERNGYPFQYSCLGNSMDRRAWRTTVDWVAKSQT